MVGKVRRTEEAAFSAVDVASARGSKPFLSSASLF